MFLTKLDKKHKTFVIETCNLYIEFQEYYGVNTMILIEEQKLCFKTDSGINTK